MPIGQSAYTNTNKARRHVDVLRHEAGHMMVARLLGFDTRALKFLVSQAGAEVNLDPDLPDTDAVMRYIEHRIIILYAGVMAEAFVNGEIDGDFALKLLDFDEAANDFAKIRELLKILTGVTRAGRDFQAVLTENNDRMWAKCGGLVEKYASGIDEVSKDFRVKLGGLTEMTLEKTEIEALPSVNAIELGSEA
jgi:hypothetical protein